MIDARNANALGKVPLHLAVCNGLLTAERPEFALRPVNCFPVLAIDRDSSIELQVADVVSLLAINMVEDLGIGEVAVESEIAGNVLLDRPIDQLLAQDSVVLEGCAVRDTDVLL